MKRLLALLGSAALLASTSATVVACDTNKRITEATLNEETLRALIASVFGDEQAAAIDFGDIFSKGDISKSLINIINRLIAQNNYHRATNNLFDSLGLGKNSEEEALKSYQILNNSIATDKLYTDYTKSISGAASTQALDYSIRRQSYSLNSQNLTLKVDGEDKEFKNVGVKLNNNKLWHIRNELDTTNYEENIPTALELSGKGFKLVDISNGLGNPVDIPGYGDLTGKEALKYRFKDWFENEIQSKIIENLLSISRQIPEAFRVATGSDANKKSAYFNRYSAIGKYSQTWNTSSTPWTSNVKMVWEFTYKNTNFDAISTALKGLTAIDQNSGILKEGEKLADQIKTFSALSGNLSEDGNDPYFSQPGFKGFISIKDGEIYGTNNLATDFTYKTSLIEAQEPGILGENGHLYFQGTKSDEISVVFVLPVYLIELLQDYEIKREADGEESAKLNLGPSATASDQYNQIWNQEQNKKKHSKDIEGLSSDLKQEMINQFHYIVSQNEDVLKESKTSLYSIYLDADDILYSSLWDSISKYIKEEE